jgi:putative addiction module killer protein
LELGNYGDVKSVGEGVSELRIDYGPGYRLYLTKVGNTIVLLLCGGTKKSQSRDIAKANKMAKSIR